jgi:hypothetical protein
MFEMSYYLSYCHAPGFIVLQAVSEERGRELSGMLRELREERKNLLFALCMVGRDSGDTTGKIRERIAMTGENN